MWRLTCFSHSYPFAGFWACCAAVNASCCADHSHCCPHDFPTCGPGGTCKKKKKEEEEEGGDEVIAGLESRPAAISALAAAGAPPLTKQCNDTFVKDCPGLWGNGTQCLICLHKHGADMMSHGCPSTSWPQPVYEAFCDSPPVRTRGRRRAFVHFSY